MREVRDYPTPANEGTRTHVYEMGEGGSAAELHIAVEPNLPSAEPCAGGVHHVAFRIPDADYGALGGAAAEPAAALKWAGRALLLSEPLLREPNGVLFGIATDGPGFATDEPLAALGEKLSLPPFLEGRRRQIEAGLRPL